VITLADADGLHTYVVIIALQNQRKGEKTRSMSLSARSFIDTTVKSVQISIN
jgi:hypothetical protein